MWSGVAAQESLPKPRVSAFTRQTFCQEKQERVEKRLHADHGDVSNNVMKHVREVRGTLGKQTHWGYEPDLVHTTRL